MGVTFRELRETCQLPVRSGNDVAGLLFGDHASLPLTKLWIDLRLSPDVATVGMLVTGLVGSGLQLLSGGWMVLGAALLVLYYVLDCVDGEVARFRRVENIKWGYYEYLFHMLVKPVSFVAVGYALTRELGSPLFLLAGASGAVAALWLKLFVDLPAIQFVHGVIGPPPGKDRAFRRYAEEHPVLRQALADRPADPRRDSGRAAEASSGGGFPLGLNLVTLRALGTNFDVGLLLLLGATTADLWLAPFALPGLGATTCRGAWMLWYGLILPLDFLDYLRTYLSKGHFPREMARMLTLAHHFQSPPPDDTPA